MKYKVVPFEVVEVWYNDIYTPYVSSSHSEFSYLYEYLQRNLDRYFQLHQESYRLYHEEYSQDHKDAS